MIKMPFRLKMPQPFLHLAYLLGFFSLFISSLSGSQLPSPAGGSWLTLEPGMSATVADNPSLDTGFDSGFTLEFWMYLTDFPKEAEQWPVMGKRSSYQIWLEGNEPDINENTFDIRWFMSATGGSIIMGIHLNRKLEDITKKWVHVAFQAEGNINWGHLNGERRLHGGISGRGNPQFIVRNTDSPFSISFSDSQSIFGIFPYNQVNRFEGVIDEVRISSIRRYFERDVWAQIPRKFQPDAHTAALWHFDEAPNTRFYLDASGNGNTLQLVGTTTVEPKAKLATTWGQIKRF